jgi:glycosyltransferase involved in cell wall biosynthesis
MLSILLPTFNGEKFLPQILKCIIDQTYLDFEVIIVDDNSTDRSRDILYNINDKRFKIYFNTQNIGFPKNIRKCYANSSRDLIITLCQDDFIPNTLFESYYLIYKNFKNVNAISRNYFLYNKNKDRPFRLWKFTKKQSEKIIINKNSNLEEIKSFFSTLDNMTGLSFRRLDFNPFHKKDLWTAHVYPFIYHLQKGDMILINRYMFAGTIHNNQSRLKKAYINSPMEEWIRLCKKIKILGMENISNYLIKEFVAKNFVGLVQIKIFSNFISLTNEIKRLIKYNIYNLLNIKFIFYSLLCLIFSKKIVSKISDFYKFQLSKFFLEKKNIKLYTKIINIADER